MSVPNNVVEAAITQARLSMHRFRVGAVLYRKGRIIGSGRNDHIKTHPQSPHPFKTKHAEFSAFLDVDFWNLSDPNVAKDVSLYVHRLKADGSPGLSKPCFWCWGMINQLGIRNVDWSK